jgi:hypothetical protein
MIPDDVYELQRQVRERSPHLLHFFCHGSSEFGANLEISNLLAESGESPLYLDASHFQPLGKVAWLISVNACEGARPFADGHSFAYQVVEGGAPAVYAMREAVSASDAHAFCGGLFTEALQHIEEILGRDHDHELDWTAIQAPARERILRRLDGHPEEIAESRSEWTLPVLYVRAGPLRVRPLAEHSLDGPEVERLQGQLDILRDFQAELHPDSPHDVRESVDAHVRALEEALGALTPAESRGQELTGAG